MNATINNSRRQAILAQLNERLTQVFDQESLFVGSGLVNIFDGLSGAEQAMVVAVLHKLRPELKKSFEKVKTSLLGEIDKLIAAMMHNAQVIEGLRHELFMVKTALPGLLEEIEKTKTEAMQ